MIFGAIYKLFVGRHRNHINTALHYSKLTPSSRDDHSGSRDCYEHAMTFGAFFKSLGRNSQFAGLTYLTTTTTVTQFMVIAALLSKTELGVYGLWMAVATLISGVASWGFVPVAIRMIMHEKSSSFQITLQCALCSSFLSVMLVLLVAILEHVFSFTGRPVIWLVMACVSSAELALREILLVPYHCKKMFRYIGLIRLISTIAVAVLSVSAVIVRPTATQIVLSTFLINGIVVIWLLAPYVRKRDATNLFSPDRSIIHTLLKEGLPIMATNFSGTMFNRLDWLVLGTMSNKTILGGYSVINRLFEFSYQLSGPFTAASYPSFCSSKASLAKSLRGIRWKVFFCGASLSVLEISLFPILCRVFSFNKFLDQYLTFAILVSGLPVIFMVGVYYQYFLSQGMQTYLFKISLMCIAVNALMLLVLVSRYASVGAAVATLIPQILQYIFMSRKLKRMIES